jgi:iron complex transport system ATP-binding protein
VIIIDRVSVRYRGRSSLALDDVSITAPRGRLTAVVGPNGSGKSTLVRALVGRVPLEGGRILIDGEPVRDDARRALARRVAVVTQREEPAFPLGVREYVALGRYPHLGLWRGMSAADTLAIDRAIELTETTPYLGRAVTELSGGEWQRVRLARAVAQGGDALVLDEPTTFLDIGHEMAVFELLSRLASDGQAVLLVSHQLNLVARFAGHMVLLHRGTVSAEGSPADVMQGGVLEAVYDWPLVVTRDPAVGAPSLVPLRARPRG